MRQNSLPVSLLAMLLLACLPLLSGCSGAPVFATGPFSPGAKGLHGQVWGGQQPVSGSLVQLFKVGTTGNGSTPTQLLTAAVYTDANGIFNITGDYSCEGPNELVYLTVTGGQPIAGITNNHLFLMSALGSCTALQTTGFISINEITTVASIYALAPFLSSGGAIGASSTNTAGIANAFATVNELTNIYDGSTPGPALPVDSVLEVQKITALADAMAPCINSDGGFICNLLFAAATVNGAVPASIPDALMNIVLNPIANPDAVFDLIAGDAPFATAMAQKPHDWSLTMTYGDPLTGHYSAGTGCAAHAICSPTAVAVDANGNVWVDQYNGGVSEFSPLGEYLTTVTGGGLAESYGMTIDPHNQIWVTNEETRVNGSHGSLTTISADTASITSGAGISGSGIYFPVGIASAVDGSIWIGDYGNSAASKVTSTGDPVAGSPFASGVLDFPVTVAVDDNGQAWFGNQSNNTITSISQDGLTVQNVTCCRGASGLAVDRHQNVWVTNYFGDSVSEVSSSGTVLIQGVADVRTYHPQGIAIDGEGTVWVGNYRGNSLSALTGSDTATPGQILTSNGLGTDAVTGDGNRDPALMEPFGVAIDASGSIWVSNYGSDALVRFIGLAAPVKTPLNGAVKVP